MRVSTNRLLPGTLTAGIIPVAACRVNRETLVPGTRLFRADGVQSVVVADAG
jgi:hypothetical protein